MAYAPREAFSRGIGQLALLSLGLLSVLLQGCSQKYARVQIFSEPLGAEVRTPKGEVLGLTPLTLEGAPLKQAAPDGRLLSVVLDAPGYVASQYTMEVRGKDKHEVKLRRVDEQAFREAVLFQYGVQVNEMVRDLMAIQGLVIVKKLDEAERLLNRFHDKYPNVAASYVMSANLAIIRGELETAHGYLLKARSIDSTDRVVQQMLASLRSYGTRKYQNLTEEDRKAIRETTEQPERKPSSADDVEEGDEEAAPEGGAEPGAPSTDAAAPDAGVDMEAPF